MNEENDIGVSIISPLAIIECADGKKHIMDQETQDDYAVIEGNKLRMFNDPSDDDRGIQGLFYKLDDIEEIRISQKKDSIQITLVSGDCFTHEKQFGSSTVSLNLPDYTDNSMENLLTAIKFEFPSINEDLYWDVLRERPMINTRMIGDAEPKTVPYMGGGKSRELTRIRAKLSTRTAEIVSPKGNVKTVHFSPDRFDVDSAIFTLAKENPKDTFIDTIRRVVWDGIHRIDTFLYNAGCSAGLLDPKQDQEYLRIVWRATLISVIQRHLDVPQPIPFVPIFIGEQGVGKSTLCKRVGLETWYRDTTKSFDDQKAFYESVQGACIVELKEGTQLEKGMLATIKANADAFELHYRKSYSPDSDIMRIYYTMIATTNNEAILRDDANRRFFPIHMAREDASTMIEDFSDEHILQMWAEALEMYRNGQRWDSELYVDERGGLKDFIQQVQGSATQLAGWEVRLKELIDKYHPRKGDEVTSTTIRFYLENGDPEYFDDRIDYTTGKSSRKYQPDLYKGKDLDAIMLKFGRGSQRFDLLKIRAGNETDPKTGNRTWVVRYRRVRDAQ